MKRVFKGFICIGIILLLFGCNMQEEFVENETSTKTTLQGHVTDKGRENYNVGNWCLLKKHSSNVIPTIDTAQTLGSQHFIGLGKHENLDSETELYIIQWYYNVSQLNQELIDDWLENVRCYGFYNDYFLFIKRGWAAGFTFYVDSIGGLDFWTNGKIMAWKHGKAYSMQELYDNGSISNTDLEKIYQQNREVYFFLYNDNM